MQWPEIMVAHADDQFNLLIFLRAKNYHALYKSLKPKYNIQIYKELASALFISPKIVLNIRALSNFSFIKAEEGNIKIEKNELVALLSD